MTSQKRLGHHEVYGIGESTLRCVGKNSSKMKVYQSLSLEFLNFFRINSIGVNFVNFVNVNFFNFVDFVVQTLVHFVIHYFNIYIYILFSFI